MDTTGGCDNLWNTYKASALHDRGRCVVVQQNNICIYDARLQLNMQGVHIQAALPQAHALDDGGVLARWKGEALSAGPFEGYAIS